MDDVNMLRRELAFTRNTIRDMEKAMREYADKTGRILDYRAIEIARLRSMLADHNLNDEDKYKQAQAALLNTDDRGTAGK